MKTKPAADPDQREEQAIRDMVDTWLQASERGDLATMLNLVADDVIFMVPDRDPFGKEEFARNFQGMKDVKLKTTSDIQEIKVLGDWAWMRNFLRVSFTPTGGKPMTHAGYVLTILHRAEDGHWVIARDANFLGPEANS